MKLIGLLTRKGRRRFARYRFILGTLVAHGFGEMVYRTGFGRFLHVVRRAAGRPNVAKGQAFGESTTWERIRMAVEELGPTFIKLGQILSNRPDLIPRELQVEFRKLQENVPPFPTERATALIINELGGPMQEFFAEFDATPVAAASIAQLHRAVLVSGEVVAVKVQRPGLRELVDVDIDILMELAALLERYVPESRAVGPRDMVAEFDKAIHQELDFQREAASIERFRSQFSDEPRIKVPQVFRRYSTHLVLTMEYVVGRPLAELLSQEPFDIAESKRVAKLGADLTFKQIFCYGFFHADPHPGNILILEDGRFGYLDFGLTGSLTQRDLEAVSDMLVSIIGGDEQKAARAVVRLAGSRDFGIAGNIEREIAELIGRFENSQPGDLSFTAFLSEIIVMLVGKGLRLPPDLFLLVKSLITIEGVAAALDPQFDFAANLAPFVKSLLRDRYDLQRLGSRFATTAGDYAELLQSLPGDYFKLIDKLTGGKMQFRLDESSQKLIHQTVFQATSALAFAIVLGSLIIGSALIVHSKVPPLWHQIPVIGILGFITAGLVGFWLLVKTIRNGVL